ncbi:MAG: hypothetical protein NVSMB64_23960 [Candidatus Velthaea sp.]
MILALTANGPGEFAGWVRPLLAALFAREPGLDVRLFFVPDDYATGREADVARALFPQAHVYAPREYLRFALGGSLAGLPGRVDRVQYLGGDLMHVARLHKRLGGVATSYKFSRRSYRDRFARVFAVDEANREQLLGSSTPPDRIQITGNLAIDGALAEAAGAFGDPPSDAARDGIIILPGSRKYEVANAYPMFLAVAIALRERLGPGVPIAFGCSPFTTDAELAGGLSGGGDYRAFGVRGELIEGGRAIRSGAHTFALVRATMRAAAHARLAIAIPGTKLIELAALGIPAVACVPLNAPELAVINGPLQYLGRLPGIGAPLKRAVTLAVASRFTYFAQPNIDAGREILPELSGTLFPSRIAAVAAERYADAAWCRRAGAELRGLYAGHAGAAQRMSTALLETL